MRKVYTAEFAGRTISVTAHYVAGQSDGSVLVTYGDTVVLVTASSQKTPKPTRGFVPLTVDYQEMTAAAGKIPGGFFKREGRPNEKEILTSRIIDRSIRPLFPKGFNFETQIIATVLSFDNDNGSDICALLGASAALAISDIPFNGPLAGARVGRVNGEFVCNPTGAELEASDLDLFLTGRKAPVSGGDGFDVNLVMLEGGAAEVSEDMVVDAIEVGLRHMRPVILLQDEIVQAIGKAKRTFAPDETDPAVVDKITAMIEDGIQEAYGKADKQERRDRLQAVADEAIKKLSEGTEGSAIEPAVVGEIFESVEKKLLRDMILNKGKRIGGRSPQDVREIACEVGLLPRTHGSALFTRGETQALCVVTLGTSSDEQRLDYISGEEMRTFMLHYNFPPFCVGEVKPLRGPGRREIGHGALARRALLPVLPSQEEFPYTVRIVSEILSSNGSSSMATVCGGSLSLMDCGVPIKKHVAGVAMGLLKDKDRVVVLTDILGDEDHAGDMDFKVCGTGDGITALQMDIKTDGINREILQKALRQAREARLLILGKLKETLAAPRETLSPYAPRITTLKISAERIRDVIGSGGKTIRHIISETGVAIDVEDDGTVTIASNNEEASSRAIAMILSLTEEAEIGKIYMGTVKKIVDFGAFVEIFPGTDGLVHISQLAKERVARVTDVLHEGDTVAVKVIEIDKSGKIRLSRKDALDEPKQ